MALTIRIARGKTFAVGEAVSTDALNALGLPVVVIDGSVGTSDIDPGAVTSAVTRPGPHFYAVATGTANALLAAPSPALIAAVDGALVFVKASATNTGPATLNVNGLGAAGIRRGPQGFTLLPGDILFGGIYAFQWNGTTWDLLNPSNPPQRVGVDNASTADHLIVTCTPPLTALYTGAEIQFKAPLDVVASVDLNADGLGAKSIRKDADQALAAANIKAGQILVVRYDATLNGAAGGWALVTPIQQAGPILQIVRTETAAVVTSDTNRAIDDNDLLQSQMDLVAALETVFTPKSASSRIRIEVDLTLAVLAGTPNEAIVALFEGTAVDDVAIAAEVVALTSGECRRTHLVKYLDSVGVTALTFRVGLAAVDEQIALNEYNSGGANFGDKLFSSVTVTEYLP